MTRKKGIEDKRVFIAEIIEKCSSITGLISTAVRHYGVKSTLKYVAIVFLGIIIAAFYLWIGWYVPKFLIKKHVQPQVSSEKPVRLEKLIISPIKKLPRWLKPYQRYYEIDDQQSKDSGNIKDFSVCTITSKPVDSAKTKFDWIIEVTHDDYEISGYGFRVTSDGYFKLLSISKISQKKSPTDPISSVAFDAPNLSKGDKLLAVLSIRSKTIALSTNCENLIKSNP